MKIEKRIILVILLLVGLSLSALSVAFASTVALPSDLKVIEEEAFSGDTSIDTLVLPGGVTTIHGKAFADCTSLSLAVIPDSVTSIHSSAFENCPNLTLRVFKDSYAEEWAQNNSVDYTYIDEETYVYGEYTYSLTKGNNITIVEYRGNENGTLIIPSTINGYRVTKIGEEAFQYCTAKRVELPNTLIELDYQAFNYCEMEELILPDSLQIIGSWAFSGCRNITEIHIPNSVAQINGNPFYGCHGLTAITVDESHPVYGIYQNALIQKDNMKLITIPFALVGETLTIPDGIKIIGDTAFGYNGPSFTRVIIPDSVEVIESSAFCFSPVQHVEIGSGVKQMEYGPFTYCGSLKTVVIKDGTTVIGSGAFSHCGNLESITIPDSVTSISSDAFSYDYYVSFVASHNSYAQEYAQSKGIPCKNP